MDWSIVALCAGFAAVVVSLWHVLQRIADIKRQRHGEEGDAPRPARI
jgi:hypothetical protein